MSNETPVRPTERDLPFLAGSMKDVVSKWKEIGLSLGFKKDDLTTIEHNLSEGPNGYFREMLNQWLRWAPPNDSWPTLEALASALRDAGEEQVSHSIFQGKFLLKQGR